MPSRQKTNAAALFSKLLLLFFYLKEKIAKAKKKFEKGPMLGNSICDMFGFKVYQKVIKPKREKAFGVIESYL